jgi:hypothetical protein
LCRYRRESQIKLQALIGNRCNSSAKCTHPVRQATAYIQDRHRISWSNIWAAEASLDNLATRADFLLCSAQRQGQENFVVYPGPKTFKMGETRTMVKNCILQVIVFAPVQLVAVLVLYFERHKLEF